jgi:alpha-N-acetylglucosaminidase
MLSEVAFLVVLVASSTVATPIPSFPPHLVGDVSAVYAMIERVIPGASDHFSLSLSPNCAGVQSGTNCFTLTDDGSKIAITGTTASEITGGVGVYLREYCGMTVGWVRGGGTNVFLPSSWPKIGGAKGAISQARSVPYSHVTQVCTHSYTLVWQDWAEWGEWASSAVTDPNPYIY